VFDIESFFLGGVVVVLTGGSLGGDEGEFSGSEPFDELLAFARDGSLAGVFVVEVKVLTISSRTVFEPSVVVRPFVLGTHRFEFVEAFLSFVASPEHALKASGFDHCRWNSQLSSLRKWGF